ncbi:MAG: class I SAM-dependent methyltransferase [Nanoarchaeota archaeon]|nr:class I SAM-dependent methyltransferase [Nanoarchaeota archaeon]
MINKIPNYVKNVKGVSRGLNNFVMERRLINELRKRKNHKIKLLEIGCGRGILLLELRKKFSNLDLYGINLNRYHGIKEKKDFIRNAEENKIFLDNKEKSNLPKINFWDVGKKIPYKENFFDLIISNVSFVHVKNKAKALEETSRILKVGGVALISFDAHETKKNLGNKFYNLYKELDKKMKKDYMPRFLIKKEKEFVGTKEFFREVKKEGFDISVRNTDYKDKSQKVRGVQIILKKKREGKLDLRLRYNKSKSEKITKEARGKNPACYGAIDFYELN